MATQYLQIDSDQYPTEFELIKEFADLMGLKNTTALLLHVRQTMPGVISHLKELSAPSEKENPQSVETPDKKDTNNPCLECQAKITQANNEVSNG